MLVDANLLLYSVDEASRFHGAALDWLESALNGPRRVGIPWMSITAFVRIATNARAMANPLSAEQAWDIAESWMDAPSTWIPLPGHGHREILGRLLRQLDLRGNLVTDAVLAALCIEHGLEMVSADSDFARFGEISWVNPLAGSPT